MHANEGNAEITRSYGSSGRTHTAARIGRSFSHLTVYLPERTMGARCRRTVREVRVKALLYPVLGDHPETENRRLLFSRDVGMF